MHRTDQLIANKKLFRKRNEALIKVAEFDDSLDALDFFCECSNVTCYQIITLSADDYIKIHKDRRKFILIPGHEVPSIESVSEKNDVFYIVKTLPISDDV